MSVFDCFFFLIGAYHGLQRLSMLKCQEKAALGVALVIVLAKEKIKFITGIFKEYYNWLCELIGCSVNRGDIYIDSV